MLNQYNTVGASTPLKILWQTKLYKVHDDEQWRTGWSFFEFASVFWLEGFEYVHLNASKQDRVWCTATVRVKVGAVGLNG